MGLRTAILALILCATTWIAPDPAQAQPVQGPYVSLGGGARFAFPVRTTASIPGFASSFDLHQNTGWASQVSAGFAFGNGWRVEAEGLFEGGTVSSGSGTWRNLGVMGNALFDVDVGSPYVFPYIGLGVGYVATGLSGVTLAAAPPAPSYTVGGQRGNVAAQVIGGLSFPVPNRPGWSVIADYRLKAISGGDNFRGTGGAPLKLHTQLDQAILIGIRFAFDTPPPEVQ